VSGAPPGYPSRRKLLAIGATLAVIATIAGLLAPEEDAPREAAPTPAPSVQAQPDRPRE
jgi:hypothetical protein